MKAFSARTLVRWAGVGRLVTLPNVAVLVATLATIAYGGQITIFWDDFENHVPGSNPGDPPIGEPWQIAEADPDGIDVRPDGLDPPSHVLYFGRYRNTALAPFSALDRQRIALERNATIRFDYFGFTGRPRYSQYFDVGAYDPVSGVPAFVIRISPQENPGSGRLHDVHYLDPAGGLVDTDLDVVADSIQPITITADLANETFHLGVEGGSASLPLFSCPSELAGVEFANYGVAMGSGTIDNLSVTVTQFEEGPGVPEVATLWMAVAGLLALLGAWAATRYAK